MGKTRMGIAFPVLLSLFILTPAAFFLMLPKFASIRSLHRKSGLEKAWLSFFLGPLVWGLILMAWGIAMFYFTWFDGKPGSASSEKMNMPMTLWYSLPLILVGIQLILYWFAIRSYEAGLEKLSVFIRGGILDMQSLEAKLGCNEKKLFSLVDDATANGLIPLLKADLYSRKYIPEGGSGIPVTKEVAWKCAACGAMNKVIIRQGEAAVCEYCKTPR